MPDPSAPWNREHGADVEPMDWARLFGAATPADALVGVAEHLGPGLTALRIESDGAVDPRPASWLAPEPRPSAVRTHREAIGGTPGWSLVAECAEPGPAAGELLEAARAVALWRAARAAAERAARALSERTQELDLIQSLGRRAAESHAPEELYRATFETLGRAVAIDLAGVVHAPAGEPEIVYFLGRPVAPRTLEDLARKLVRSSAAAGGPSERRVLLDGYDDSLLAAATEVRDPLLLPVRRRGREVATLWLSTCAPIGETELRLCYTAANHVSLHLDRILSLREAEADRFRLILDSMPQAVLLTDRALRVLQANRGARTFLEGLGSCEGRSLLDVEALARLRPLREEVVGGGAAVAAGELTLPGDRTFAATLSPLGASGSHGEELVLVLTDVTEGRRLQRRLAHAEKMSSLGQMISGVAHELNNPLASVVGYAQLLGAKAADEAQERRLRVLERESVRCKKIVQNLLSFARQREPEMTTMCLNEVVRSVLALMEYQLRVEGVRVRPRLDPELPAIRGDGDQLQQVIVNLLTNAKHAIRHAGPHGWIDLVTERTAHGVALTVRDDGPGVPVPVRHRIFDPFFTTKEEGRGTGLGLSLAYGIVREHSGTIELVDDGREQGATFRIELPLPGAFESEVRAGAEPADAPLEVPPGNILVVDDDEPVGRLIGEALSEDGHTTQVVHDGAEALRRLRCEPFDLIIADMKMPGMSGEELYEEIRSHSPELSRRVLLTTGDTLEDSPFVARTKLELVRKPFDLDHLLRAVRSRLGAPRDAGWTADER